MSDNHNFQRLKKNQSKKRKSAKWTPYSSKHIRLCQKQMNKTQLFETNGNDIVPDGKKQKTKKRESEERESKKKKIK